MSFFSSIKQEDEDFRPWVTGPMATGADNCKNATPKLIPCRGVLPSLYSCRSTEDFSYFTLLRPARPDAPATSLFGISCTRQMDSSQLLVRPPDVTRSTVQKAVVVIADTPQYFGMLRESLSVVTQAWFAQREFTDTDILRRFQESLAEERERGALNRDEDRDQYLGMSLRELVREFRWQTLVLLKCCLLQPKVSRPACPWDRLPVCWPHKYVSPSFLPASALVDGRSK